MIARGTAAPERVTSAAQAERNGGPGRHKEENSAERPRREMKGKPMRNDHVTLRSTAVFDLLAPRTPAVPVKVELRYDTHDPYAVVAAFRTVRAGWVEWCYARDRSTTGLLA